MLVISMSLIVALCAWVTWYIGTGWPIMLWLSGCNGGCALVALGHWLGRR